MSLTVPYKTEVAADTIRSARWNSNMSTIETWANTHETTVTGIHGVGAGNIMGTTINQTITGKNTFSGADTILLPSSTPTVGQSTGYVAGNLVIYDSTPAATRSFPPVERLPVGLYNVGFKQGADTSQLRIAGGDGNSLGATNIGFIRVPKSSTNSLSTYTISSNIDIDLTGAHWGLDGKGDNYLVYLRVYAINNLALGVTTWGVGMQGGFTYVTDAQTSITAASITTPEMILTNNAVSAQNDCYDVGYIEASFIDASNEWVISGYYPNRSADGLWQTWNPSFTGFSVDPASGTGRWTMVGSTVMVEYRSSASGTSNATSFTMVAPIKAKQIGCALTGGSYIDNGAAATGPVVIKTSSSSATLNLYKTYALGGWTNINGKVAEFQCSYESYRP